MISWFFKVWVFKRKLYHCNEDTFTGSVSALLRADYRKDGGEDMLCCSLDGEVRGYRAQEGGGGGAGGVTGAGGGGAGGGGGGGDMLDRDANEVGGLYRLNPVRPVAQEPAFNP